VLTRRHVARSAFPFTLWTIALCLIAPLAWAEERQTLTLLGVPLSEPRTIEAQGRTFRIPAGYLFSWHFPEASRQTIKREGFGFAFWMPSRRFPENEPSSTPSFRPREAGRTHAPGEYLVKAHFEFEASKQPGFSSPLKQFTNRMSLRGSDSTYAFRERFGLVEFWRPNAPNAFTLYRHVEGTEPEVLMDCSKPDDPVPNPSCAAHVYFAERDLALFVTFSRNDIENWRENVTVTVELIDRWMLLQHER
jgi:hypothetical protein